MEGEMGDQNKRAADLLRLCRDSFPFMDPERYQRYIADNSDLDHDEEELPEQCAKASDPLRDPSEGMLNPVNTSSTPDDAHFDLIEEAVRYRQVHGMTQRELADILQISARTLAEWEQRRRSPRGPARALLLTLLESHS